MDNKERINAVTEQLKAMQAKVFQKSQGENGEYYKGLLDGTLTEFSAPKAGVTSLRSYRFSDFKNLTKADFTGVITIPAYICNSCTSLSELILDPDTIKIDDRAFKDTLVSGDLVFKDCYLGYYAFYNTKINSISGSITNMGNYGFYEDNYKTLKLINLKINGQLGDYGFYNCFEVNRFILNPESNITYLGSRAFNLFGCNRENPETNIFTFDFRNSTFNEIQYGTFVGGSTTNKNKYFDIYFPETMTNISSSSNFQYTDHFNIFYKSIPTLSNVNNFTNATNYKNFFPYDQVKDAKVATNWSSTTNGIVDSIYGWAEENTFTQGQTLPTTDSQGWALTWYSDIDLTQEVTTVDDPAKIYYCIVGERIAVVLTQLSKYQATCTVTDSAGNTYTQGSIIPIGTVITITAVGEGENTQPYVFTLNGNTIASGDTYTIGAVDVSIVCIYWDGVNVPVNPTFSENTPAQIKAAVDNGLHRTFWTIGDEKQIELTDGRTVTLRYIDQKANRYEKTDGSGYTNAVFEINPLIAQKRMNATNTNAGGWPATEMSTVTMAELYALLPTDWQSIFSEAKIPSATSGNDSTIVTANNKSFIASGQEIFAAQYVTNYYYDEGCTQFDWYSQHNTNTDRIKKYQGSNAYWWLRSPYRGSSSGFCAVSSNGYMNYNSAITSFGVCLCLAI